MTTALRFLLGATACLALLALGFLESHRGSIRAGPWAPAGGATRRKPTAATYVTLLRGVLVALLGGFALAPPARAPWLWAPGLLWTAAALLDRADGWVARTRGEVSAAGAWLDTWVDALGLLVAPLCAVALGRLPLAYLAVGAAFYVHRLALALRQLSGRPVGTAPPSDHGRIFAGLNMGLVAAALLPGVPCHLLDPVAAVFATALLGGFVWQWLCETGRLSGRVAALRRLVFVGLPWVARGGLVVAAFLYPLPWLWPWAAAAALGVLPRLSALGFLAAAASGGLPPEPGLGLAAAAAATVLALGGGVPVLLAPDEGWIRRREGAR